MEVIFNGRLLSSDQVQLQPGNRAFAYGDGLFETMLVRDGSCPLLPYHFSRLQKGTHILQLELPFNRKELEELIRQLAGKSVHPLLRMRLQVWRKEGGLYAPQQKESEYLLTASSFEEPPRIKKNAAFSNTVQLSNAAYSSLKTMNALPYVLAGLERRARGLDELILTDTMGHVAECSAANIFWYKEDCWYTPALESGCIAGVMRAYLLDQMRSSNIAVKEVLLPKEKLLEAAFLIACNATGLWSIVQLENKPFPNGKKVLEQLIPPPAL
jgi:branched-subunit amino acid aminotransferase/4-amino-4-deoxychorismate lyase